ncbi:MAG: hypothetical protein ACOCSD_01410 [Halolamina sp.]
MTMFGTGLFLLTVGHAVLKLATTTGGGALFGDGSGFVLAAAAASQAIDLAGLSLVFYSLKR